MCRRRGFVVRPAPGHGGRRRVGFGGALLVTVRARLCVCRAHVCLHQHHITSRGIGGCGAGTGSMVFPVVKTYMLLDWCVTKTYMCA